MQNKLRTGAFLFILSSVLFTACKKDSSATNTDTTITDAQVQVHNDDENTVGNEMDAVDNDANVAFESNASFSGRLDGTTNLQGMICNASVVFDTLSNPRKITVTYNGPSCTGTESRTGTVVFSMAQGVHWRDSGAVATVQITNLKITRVRDNKSITINGSHTITNKTGGKLSEFPNRILPIIHTITSSNMTITFDDNTQRTWQVARQRTFTWNNGLVITLTGMHTDGSTTGITEWGTTRYGGTFVTAVTQPLVFRQDCSFRLVSGQVEHSRIAATATVTFGLDASGNPVSCPTGSYYMKVVIARTNQAAVTVLLPY
jgi:hypothetical protein